ncbi:MAG: extracellular solute-binding protein [Gammaproteobacteria bacterium]|nr:extracellular solute-binding protein [Gammaproteobacteria bacterium]
MEQPRARSILLLFALSIHPLAHVVADTQSLEFRHGVSQIPNYELKYPADFPHFNHLNVDAPKGGTLVLPWLKPLDTVSPMYQPAGFYRSYDHLIERAGDELSGYYGSLAESIALSADRRRIVFRLRPQARWHDGRPITATDVKFSVETFRADVMAHGWAGALAWVTDVNILNPLTVEIRADSDVAKQLFILGYMPIVPAHFWLGRDVREPITTPPPQSGPYRLTGVSQGRYVTYERVPDYWGRDLPVNRGKFNFDTIRYERYLDATVAREALRAGLLDVWTETDSRHWLKSYDVPARDHGWLVLGTRASGNRSGARYILALNTRRQPFDDIRVREALAHALDFEWQIRALHGGQLTRANSFFADSLFASSGLPDESETAFLEPHRAQLPAEVFTHPFSFPITDGMGVDRDGLSRARALLEKAGYRVVDGVMVNDVGEPFVIEFLSFLRSDQRILLPYLRSLSILGIQADIRMIDQTGYYNRRRNADYDATLVGGGFEVPPSWELRPYFHSSSTLYLNASGLNDPAIDALVEAALSATHLNGFVSACRALDRVLLWNYYQVPLDALGDTRIVYWDKFGRPDLPEEMYVAPFPDGWWFDEEKAARISF